MRHSLRKRFSIGFSYCMTPEEFKRIIDDYEYYIHDVYFSPPFAGFIMRKTEEEKYHTTPHADDLLYDVMNYCHDKGILLNMAINAHHLRENEVLIASQVAARHVKVDYITTLPKYAKILRAIFPNLPFLASYNSKVKTLSDLEQLAVADFQGVVLGNSMLRDFEAFSHARFNGLRVTVLVNNGCSHSCVNFCDPNIRCKLRIEENLKNGRTPSELYAEQTLMPWEVHKYYLGSRVVHLLKLASRPSLYTDLVRDLDSYIRNVDVELARESREAFHRWSKLKHLNDLYEQFDLDAVMECKKGIWDAQAGQIDNSAK